MSKEPLLALSTLEPVRDVVTIDGVGYELAAMEDFGVREQTRLSALYRRFAAVGKAEEPGPAEEVEVQQLYDEIIRLIMRGLPDEYLGTVKVPKGKGKPPVYTEGKLRFAHKRRIITVFTRGRLPRRPRNRRTGPTSSRPSAASTAPTTG